MFTGIIETIGLVEMIEQDGSNYHFKINSSISRKCKVDQSVSHNGVCLTITKIENDSHWVTAIQETLDKTNLLHWKEGTKVNLERCLQMNGRLDGHLVQGHVDGTGLIKSVKDSNGSWVYEINFDSLNAPLLVSKGSVCINGVSLTVVNPCKDNFEVAIIPYTHAHTNFHELQAADEVNLEFDIIGKYLARFKELT